jgi:hypothetical protein
MSGTGLLAPDEEPDPDAEPGLAAQLAAQHAAELRVLTSAYEAQLAAQAETLRGRDAMIATLTQQVAAAQEEQARLQARLSDFEALTRERDTLAARLRELEQALDSNVPSNDQAAGAAPALGKLAVLEPQRFGLPHGVTFMLGREATVGRHPNSAIRIDDHYISAHHAQLVRQVDGWWVTDLGTTNGTFVNGVRVTAPTLINVGDVIRFGRVRASFA